MTSPDRARRPRAAGEPLPSQFAADPDMREVIDYFLSELSGRADAIREAFESGQAQELRHLAHQLKGAAGGYGFPSISICAEDIQRVLRAGEAELSAISERVEDLITLCRRAAAGRESMP